MRRSGCSLSGLVVFSLTLFVTQVEAAQFLKPNQDDKNVGPDEMVAYARSLGFEGIVGQGGNVDLLRHLLRNDLPVMFGSYLATQRYPEVIELTTATLKATGGLEEMYYYRGLAHEAMNQPQAAAQDHQAALAYNPKFSLTARALADLEAKN